jgi:hypothetical protein
MRMQNPDFQSVFISWLDQALSFAIPEEVISYSFNLAEPWCMEVVGCDAYDEVDPDWACEEVFRPAIPNLDLPESVVGSNWETVLASAKQMVSAYLDRPSDGARLLKEARAVGIGFVDGDIHIAWPPAKNSG